MSLLGAEELVERAKGLNEYAKRIKKLRLPRKCLCGCGGEFISPDSKGRERKYMHGHNNKNKNWKWGGRAI